MSITTFLSSIFEGDPAIVPPGSAPIHEEHASAIDVIKSIDFAARMELAATAPPLSIPAALWASERLYRACQFLVYREIEADVVRADCAISCPVAPSPSVCYSVDLVFRHLPDLFAMARGIARDDPLVEGLLEMARAWPLSSVGMADVSKADTRAFIEDVSLRRLYADRIIARNDLSRLEDPAARQSVREAIGAFPSLAPRIWAAVMPMAGLELENKNG